VYVLGLDLIIILSPFHFHLNTTTKVWFVIFSKAYRERGRFSRRRTHLPGWDRLSLNIVGGESVNGTKVVGKWMARKCHAHAPQKDAVNIQGRMLYGVTERHSLQTGMSFDLVVLLNMHNGRKP
jgi:hypothetical protein